MLTLRMSSPASTGADSGSGSCSKPVRSRRSTGKSRLGCQTCKQKRIKCDETSPTCRQCDKRGASATCKYDARPAQPELLATQPPVWNALFRTPESDAPTGKGKGRQLVRGTRSRGVSEDSSTGTPTPPPIDFAEPSIASSINLFDWQRPTCEHESSTPWPDLSYPHPTSIPVDPAITTNTGLPDITTTDDISIPAPLSAPTHSTSHLLAHFHAHTSRTLCPTAPEAWQHILSLSPAHPFLHHTILTLTLRHITSPAPATPLELYHKGLALALTSAATKTHAHSEALLAAALLLGYHTAATTPISLAEDDFLLLWAGVTSVGRSIWPARNATVFASMLSRPALLVPEALPAEGTTFATGPSSTAVAPLPRTPALAGWRRTIATLHHAAEARGDQHVIDALTHLAPLMAAGEAVDGKSCEERMDVLRMWACWACFCPPEFSGRVRAGEPLAVAVMGVYWAGGAMPGLQDVWWWRERIPVCRDLVRERLEEAERMGEIEAGGAGEWACLLENEQRGGGDMEMQW
ncbi:hypothetical protein EDC01DRAFT_464653 [Geopyxis carbonaria]|nr:hypothetical protein EDC01DRAFT_464653 [Geopyxis carbonaria]